jgi:penicillin-binding protein 2
MGSEISAQSKYQIKNLKNLLSMKKFRFGSAFVDEFKKTSSKNSHFNSSKKASSDWTDALIAGNDGEHNNTNLASIWRVASLGVFFLVFFALLFFRLFHLQIVKGQENRDLADSNRIQVRIIHAPRGVVYDRNGKILARNEPGFRLVEIDKAGTTHTTLVSRDEALKMEVNGDSRYKNLEVDSIRTYPMGQITSHLLGYVGEITPEELKDPKFLNYKSGDIVGRGGVEEVYEKVLRGVDGGEIIEVDAQGKPKRIIRRTEAIPGQKLILGIDADLQNVAYNQLEAGVKKSGSCCGSLIAEDPKTGEILAMVSYPSYDPTKLSEALTAPNSPMLNRTIGGVYPPGSTYKIASALAGLTSGKITCFHQV